MLWKCCTQYVSKFGKLSSDPRIGKDQFSFQSQRKAMLKNVQTAAQLHSSHTLAKQCSKFSERLQQYVYHKLPDVQAGFRKDTGTRLDQSANILWIIKKARKIRKNIYFCFIDYAKAFDCENHNKMWKILKEIGIPDNFTCLLRNLYAGQEATGRTRHGATDWFQTGKEYVKAVYCHPRVGVLQFPFCHLAWSCLTILQWGGWSFRANTRSEVTMSHSVPVFFSWDISLHKIFAQPSALCPQPGEEGLQMFAELGADSLWGESADQSKALLDGVFHVASPGWGIFPVLWRQTRISIRNTGSPNSGFTTTQPCLHPRQGQGYRSLQVAVGWTEETVPGWPELSIWCYQPTATWAPICASWNGCSWLTYAQCTRHYKQPKQQRSRNKQGIQT